MAKSRTITVTLTEQQYSALRDCIVLHEAEDDDYRDEPARRGVITARDNASRKLHDAWYAQQSAERKKKPEEIAQLATRQHRLDHQHEGFFSSTKSDGYRTLNHADLIEVATTAARLALEP